LDHSQEIPGELVVAGGDAAEVLELAEEALNEVALAIEPFGEAELFFAVAFGGDVWGCTLLLNMVADAVGVVGLVGQDNDARGQPVEQLFRDLAIMGLSGRQADPDREPLGVDDDVDFRREAASASTETMIWTPFFAVAACWCARIEVLSIIWIWPSCAALIASIRRSQTPAFRQRTKRL